MSNKHLPIGGSTIARTLGCNAWVSRAAKAKNLPNKAGAAANLGNLLHDAMEDYYKHGTEFEAMVGVLTFADLTLEEDHLPALYAMRNHTETVLDEYGIVDIVCEPFVELIPDLAGGSIDMLGISEDGETAVTLDYKTGTGVVRAEENKQLQFYTLCAITDKKTKALLKKVKRFVGAIIQPRVFRKADVWEFDRDTLAAFNKEVTEAIAAAQAPRPKAKAGAHCRYCPMESFCTEKRARAETALALDLNLQANLEKALPLAMELKSWCERVLATSAEVAQQGVAFAEYKLVHGQSRRRWKNKDTAKTFLEANFGEDAYTKTMLTAPQAEKKLGKARAAEVRFDNLVEKPPGKLTLVSTDDPREAVQVEQATEKLKNTLDKISAQN